jgi:hypothetical protein
MAGAKGAIDGHKDLEGIEIINNQRAANTAKS